MADSRTHALTDSDLAAGQRALHVEDGGTWFTGSHRVLRLRPEQPLLQDEPHCIPAKGNRARSLSKWLATTPDARLQAREAAAAIERERLPAKPTEAATDRSDSIGLKTLLIAGAAALAAVLSQLPF